MRHSRDFPPSSSERWLNCRRSVSFIKSLPTVPRGTASSYAAEGTVAHDIADRILTGKKLPAVGASTQVDGHDIAVTQDMVEHGTLWREIVLKRIQEPGSQLVSEHEVDLGPVVGAKAQMFGNLDARVLADRKLSILDYKYGRGIEVYPDNNTQLLCYALGEYYALDEAERDIDEVELVVVQPRTPSGDPERSWTISDLDLIMWGDKVLKPAVEAITSGQADSEPFVTGGHCRFCPAAAHCPGLKERSMKAAIQQFVMPPDQSSRELTDDELGAAMVENELIQRRIDAVAAEALRRAQTGRKIKYHKLVAKRASRQWKDPLAAAIWLREHGNETPDWYTRPELKSPTQIEKLIDKRQHGPMNQEIVTKESTGTSLVRDTDPRAEVSVLDAAGTFSDIPSEKVVDPFALGAVGSA
jgi:hypothetical protein